jgi:hypothetical protein
LHLVLESAVSFFFCQKKKVTARRVRRSPLRQE